MLISKSKFFIALAIIVCLMVPVEASASTGLSFKEYLDLRSKERNRTQVEYVLNGGINSFYNPTELEKGQMIKLYKPYRCGYTFIGWFLDPTYRIKVSNIYYIRDEGYILYAKWVKTIDNYYNIENYDYKSDETIMDCDYSFLDNLNIPGMPETKDSDFLNKIIFSESQCPQGFCMAGDFILISSYSEGSDCMGELMVFDRKTQEYLFTLGMDERSHLGGIAFDGSNIWVCNSTENAVERLSYDFIEQIARQNTGGKIDARKMVDLYPVKNTPSCITFYNNRLWIASHTKLMNSKVVAYYFDVYKDTLVKLSKYKIPPKVQGIAFAEDGRVFLSTSFGRNASSYLKVYKSVVEMDMDLKNTIHDIELPPCSEEIDIVGDGLYMIFESAGEKYFEGTDGKGKSLSPINKILNIAIDEL